VVRCGYEVIRSGWVGLGGVSKVLWGGRRVTSLVGEVAGDDNQTSGRQNWRFDKIGDSGIKRVILKYFGFTTYCSTSHWRER